MKVAYLISNGVIWLDCIGIYDPLSKLNFLNYLPDLIRAFVPILIMKLWTLIIT